MTLLWYQAEQSVALRRTAAQVIGLLLDVRADVVEKQFAALMVHVMRELRQGAADTAALMDPTTGSDASEGKEGAGAVEPTQEDTHLAFHDYTVPLVATAPTPTPAAAAVTGDDDGWTTVPEGGAFVVQDGDKLKMVPAVNDSKPGSSSSTTTNNQAGGGDDDGWVTVPEGGGFAVLDGDKLTLAPTDQPQSQQDASRGGVATKPSSAPSRRPMFIASTTFNGPKADYVFTTRNEGTGYYIDVVSLRAATAAPEHASDDATGTDAAESRPWQVVYYSLVCAEKLHAHLRSRLLPYLLQQRPTTSGAQDVRNGGKSKRRNKKKKGGAKRKRQDKDTDSSVAVGTRGNAEAELVVALSDLLVYPHSWVRLASSRVLSYALSRCVCGTWAHKRQATCRGVGVSCFVEPVCAVRCCSAHHPGYRVGGVPRQSSARLIYSSKCRWVRSRVPAQHVHAAQALQATVLPAQFTGTGRRCGSVRGQEPVVCVPGCLSCHQACRTLFSSHTHAPANQ